MENVSGLLRGKLKLFRKPLEGDSIEKPSGYELSIPLCVLDVDPFVDHQLKLAPAVLICQAHVFTFPVPLQVGQVLLPLPPLLVFTRILVVVLILTL